MKKWINKIINKETKIILLHKSNTLLAGLEKKKQIIKKKKQKPVKNQVEKKREKETKK